MNSPSHRSAFTNYKSAITGAFVICDLTENRNFSFTGTRHSFNTRSGYFCSSNDSKIISEQLRFSRNMLPVQVPVRLCHGVSSLVHYVLKWLLPGLACFGIRHSRNIAPTVTSVRKQRRLLAIAKHTGYVSSVFCYTDVTSRRIELRLQE